MVFRWHRREGSAAMSPTSSMQAALARPSAMSFPASPMWEGIHTNDMTTFYPASPSSPSSSAFYPSSSAFYPASPSSPSPSAFYPTLTSCLPNKSQSLIS
ncbi:hypothetical protein Pcinc_017594 [Petrolisthes cinctipes]|uniref:Uncharacterized protein n=1 Tax=Petrolisthes cinctipes TaxID=88211 RepID=A0AAE1FNX5_PETCI|nr:hypothetical protein Pcinc_017594 [Petrolisthes cinctipes]